MRRTALFGIVVVAAMLSASVAVSAQHLIFDPETIVWKDAPASLPKGAKVAVLRGDPTQPGLFTMRIKFPAGYIVSPHWHTQDEHATVISGGLLIAEGDKYDPKKFTRVTSGSLMIMPAMHRHFARFDQETVLQLHGMGPWVVNYVNPTDDPRNH